MFRNKIIVSTFQKVAEMNRVSHLHPDHEIKLTRPSPLFFPASERSFLILCSSFCFAGYSAAALLAILFCIPFALRVLIHKETGGWSNWPQAFYHAHLELFLGNGCLGTTKRSLAFRGKFHGTRCKISSAKNSPAIPPSPPPLLVLSFTLSH